MGECVDISAVKAAIGKRESYLLGNLATLSMKGVRRMIEQDMHLPEKALDAHKAAISSIVDQIVSQYKKQGKGDDPAPVDKITTADGKVGIAKEAKKQPGHRAVEPGGKPARPAPSKQKDATRKVSRDGSRSGEKAKPGKKRLVKKARIMETDVSNGSKKRAMEELPDEDSELEDRIHRKESRSAPRREPIQNTEITKMKQMLKATTIKISPNIYRQNKSESSLAAALEALLGKHGLTPSSTPLEVRRVRNALEQQRDLEGIDVSNIIEGNARRRRAVVPIRHRASPVRNGSSSEDESLDSGDEEQRKLPSTETQAARKDGNNRSAGRRVGDCNSGGALSDDPEDSDAAEDEEGDRTKPARVTVTTSSGSSEAGGEIVSASNGVGADDGAPAGADENHAAAGDEDFVPSDEEMDSNLAN